MVWVGGLIVLLTFVAIVKKMETRLALFLSGVIMAALAGKPAAAGGRRETRVFGRGAEESGCLGLAGEIECTIENE